MFLLLQVTGEVGPTMLFGVTSGDSAISSMSSQTSAMVQRAVEAAHSSAQPSHSVAFSVGSGGASAAQEAARWKQNEQQVAVWSQATQEQQQQQAEVAAAAVGGGCGCGSGSRASSPAATRQLVINSGWGRVELKAMGWMDGLKARMAQQGKEAA